MNSLISQISDFVAKRTEEHSYLFILLGVALIRFVNLGFADLQAWDESLYAVRTIGMIQFGNWIDQTHTSIDGSYSSFHPPLYIWLTSIAYFIIGISEFSSRFFSALFGGALLFVIYCIGKEISGARIGFVASLLFALSPFVTFYTRQGQLDMTMTFFISLSAYFMLRSIKQDHLKQRIFAGIFIGFGLLARSFVAFGIALAFTVWKFFFVKNEKRNLLWSIMAVAGIGLLIPLPWYLYMTLVHGGGNPLFIFQSSDLWEGVAIGFEGNVKSLGLLYYFNQLFVILPFGVIWFLYAIPKVIKNKDSAWMFVFLWFLIFFGVFSLVRLKLAVCILPALVPCALLASKEIVHFVENGLRGRTFSILLGATIVSVIWSIHQPWRDAVRITLMRISSLDLIIDQHIWNMLIFFGVTLLSLLLFYLMFKYLDRLNIKKMFLFWYLLPAFGISLLNIFLLDRYQYNDGAKVLGQFIQQKGYSSIVVAGYERNPQLTYYLDGVDIGWRDDMVFRRIIPPQNPLELRFWLSDEMADEPSDCLLIIEKDKFIRHRTVDALRIAPENYAIIFESRRYAAFVRMPSLDLASQSQRNSSAM